MICCQDSRTSLTCRTDRGAFTGAPTQPSERPSVTDTEEDTASGSEELATSDFSDEDDTSSAASNYAVEIEDSIGRLLQLAVRIRREGARKTSAEAAKFEPTDEHGRHLAPDFQKYTTSICQRAFNTTLDNIRADDRQLLRTEVFKAEHFLQERASRCMVDRWRRINYQRHHASNLAHPNQRAPTRPEVQRLKTKPGAPSVGRDIARVQAPTEAKDAHIPVATKALSAATSLPPHVKIDQNRDLHPKTAPTITTKVRANHLDFPPAPKVRDGLDKFKCPLCGLLWPTSLLEKRKWQ